MDQTLSLDGQSLPVIFEEHPREGEAFPRWGGGDPSEGGGSERRGRGHPSGGDDCEETRRCCPRLNTTLSTSTTTAGIVISLVSVQLVWLESRLPARTGNGWHTVQQLFQNPGVVNVGSSQQQGQRNALAIDAESIAARLQDNMHSVLVDALWSSARTRCGKHGQP